MKKVGKLTEARMAKPAEPKFHPLVSDNLFENKVKGYPSMGIKGGTKASAKEAARRKKLKEDEVPAPDDMPMNKRGRITQAGPAPKVTPKTYQTYNSMTDAKDPDWIQGAEKDIERRGTKGKCTPITKPGCTGKAKALAKTFKKMAKKRDDEIVSKKEKEMKEGSMGMRRLGRVQKGIEKAQDKNRDATWSQDDDTRGAAFKKRDQLRKKAKSTAFKKGFKGSASKRRAYATADDESKEMGVRMRAAEKL